VTVSHWPPPNSKANFQWESRVSLRLAVVLVPSPIEAHGQFLSLQPSSYGHSPCVTSLMRGCVCLLQVCLAFAKCTYCMLLRILRFARYVIPVSPVLAEQIMFTLLILRYNRSLFTWVVVSLTSSKFKPLTFAPSGFALSYAANMFTLMILCDLCLLSAQFYWTIVYFQKVEKPCANRGSVWAMGIFQLWV
jgi:hypothetical protein